jgi:hypothetical protein
VETKTTNEQERILDIKWQNFIRNSKLYLLVTLIMVSSISVKQSTDLTGIGRMHHTKTKENFQVFSTEKFKG